MGLAPKIFLFLPGKWRRESMTQITGNNKLSAPNHPFKGSVCRVFLNFRAGGDFLRLCDEKRPYKLVSDFGRLRSYDRLNLRIEGNDC